jgi:chemotaxis protein CheX
MGITTDDINQVITEVWAPSLELDLYAVGEETGVRDHVTILTATGGWEGRIVVSATASFARAVAAKMFGLPRDEVPTSDAADAIGELANVVSGNLKALLGEDEVDLGLPVTDATWDGTGDVMASTVLAAAPGFEVSVHVLEGVPATA